MTTDPTPPVELVSSWELRAMFNDAGLYDRLVNGEIDELLIYDEPASPISGQPTGTRSQELYYYDRGTKVARVHQFVLPDGSLGASGLPDPKALLVDGTLFVLEPDA